ncbi:MAG: hypothetical protein ABEH43_02440, partial [Flavobacteriales bacterium]
TTGTGSHTFTSFTTKPNDSTDEDKTNDTATTSFDVKLGVDNTLKLETDCYGGETSWELRDTSGTVLDSAVLGTYPGTSSNPETGGGEFYHTFCLSNGCYEFEIKDSYGDGLEGSNNSGCNVDGDFHIIGQGGDTLVSMNNVDFGSNEVHNFCVEDTVNASFNATPT